MMKLQDKAFAAKMSVSACCEGVPLVAPEQSLSDTELCSCSRQTRANEVSLQGLLMEWTHQEFGASKSQGNRSCGHAKAWNQEVDFVIAGFTLGT